MKTIPRERLEYVERLYLSGVPDLRIQNRASKRFGVTTRAVRRYLERVRTKLAALPKPPPEASFQRAEVMLQETYALAKRAVKYVTFQDGIGPATTKETRAVPAPEVGTMAAVAWRLAELNGVAASRVNVQVDGLASFLATGFEVDPAEGTAPGKATGT